MKSWIGIMLEDWVLDPARNEIRLLTMLDLTTPHSELVPKPDSPPRHEELVDCQLEQFSLDEYTPQYSRFLEIETAEKQASDLSILWDQFTTTQLDDANSVRVMRKSKGHKI